MKIPVCIPRVSRVEALLTSIHPISLLAISLFFSLLHFHLHWTIPSFDHPFLSNGMWVYHQETKRQLHTLLDCVNGITDALGLITNRLGKNWWDWPLIMMHICYFSGALKIVKFELCDCSQVINCGNWNLHCVVGGLVSVLLDWNLCMSELCEDRIACPHFLMRK